MCNNSSLVHDMMHVLCMFMYLSNEIYGSIHGVVGLDKICLAKFEQNGQPRKEAILQAKWAINFVQKAKWAKNEL